MEKLFAGDGEVKVDADVIDLETRLSVIQALIPLGLEAVTDVLQHRSDGRCSQPPVRAPCR